MRYPHFLPEEGTLGFIAPSFGCAQDPYQSAFHRALAIFADDGCRLNLGPNCESDTGIGISNTPEACGAEATEYLTDPANDVVISCGGGELMCEILDYVDFEAIGRAEPKWFMGFSDNTNLTFLLPTLCDTAAIYGPCAAAFGMDPWHPVLLDALGLLSGRTKEVQLYGSWELESLKTEDDPYQPYNTTEETVLVKYPEDLQDVTIRGRMLGGCLDILTLLAGTAYDKVPEFLRRYKDDGVIWFFECCDLNVFDMRRALWHLEHCGWFEHAAGFLIGRPYHYHEDMMGLDQYEAFTGILGKYHVPIIMDADLGHLPPSMPMVVGAKAELECAGNDLEIRYDFS